ncbi:MAG: glycosyltransferase family A protein, partial [Candidatus Falkowbacteria bacterium]|nr:glycosyltransferase family A protein [Candidatus Falkowbacteria bacterium]
EVIIINDGSIDNPESLFTDYIKKLAPENNYIFISQPNLGAPAARNRGFKEARGEYILFCDADAILYPQALETMWSALEQNWNASYAYSSFRWGRKLFKLGEFDPEKLKTMPYIHTMSLIRTKDFPASGWDENIKKLQDWDLWLTMLAEGKTGLFIPQVLFTVAPGGTISTWLPAAAYKLLPFLPAVKKYKAALKIVKDKHGLE